MKQTSNDFARRADLCTTHHDACDCRMWDMLRKIEQRDELLRRIRPYVGAIVLGRLRTDLQYAITEKDDNHLLESIRCVERVLHDIDVLLAETEEEI